MSEITFDDAKNFGNERRKQILANFGEEDNLSKAISGKEFDEQYGAGHEVFTHENIQQYVQKATEDENTPELLKAIEDELSSLDKVLVKGEDNSIESRYVRKAVEAKKEDEGSEDDESDEDEDSDKDKAEDKKEDKKEDEDEKED